MRRLWKIIAIAGGSLAGLVILLFIAGIIVVQTAWFHNFVREKIVSAVEDGTGGKAEVGSFAFDWTHLRAQVRNLVIHGLETPPSPPLFRANLVQIDLKLLSPARGAVDIAYLLVDTPQANIVVYPDGRTNLPAPKTHQTSNKSGLETVVDLAIGRFDLHNGSVTFAQRKSGFNASGENLRAQLGYNPISPRYVGELDVSPLQLQPAGNAPLDVNVKLPVTLETDRISLNGGNLSTPGSLIQLSGSIDHLASPQITAHVSARLSLDEIKRAAGLTLPLDTAQGPRELAADIDASAGANRISVQSARIRLGQSEITASGVLQQPNRPAGMRFDAGLEVGELGRLLRVSARPDGTIRIGGNARLDSSGNYNLEANIVGRNLAAGQGAARIMGASLDSSVAADPRRVQLGGLRLAVLGGDLVGSGALDNMRTFQFSGKLNNLGIKQIAAFFKPGDIGYSGAISGDLQASGDLKNPSGLAARAALGIQPRSGGVPVSGRINAVYNGGTGTVNLGSSYLTLPNTRLDFSGSIGRQIQVKLVTRNTTDFRPVADLPIAFQNGGNATVTATFTGSVGAPRIGAHAALTDFSVNGRPFSQFDADLDASPSGATVTNAMLTHGMLQTEINASVGLRNWKPEDFEPVRADASIRNADLADVLALAGESNSPVEGQLSADAHVEGTIGDPVGSANLSLTNGPSRLDATATYLKGGNLRAHVASNQVQLAQFQSLVKDRPGLAGVVSLNADAAASLRRTRSGTDLELTSVAANASVRDLQMQGQHLGNANVVANTNGSSFQYNVTSDFAGAAIRVNGQSLLAGDHQTSANAQISNLPIDRVLAVAGRSDLPVRGSLNAAAQISGTFAAPRASVSLSVTNGSAFRQGFNRLQATIDYSNQLLDLPQFRLDDGPNTLEISASFTHPVNDFQQGQAQFRVRTNQLQLARFQILEQAKSGLAGTVELSADGAGTLRRNAPPLISRLNANLSARGLAVDRRPLGDATLTAQTRGQEVAFDLTSNFAHSNIKGDGTLGLASDFPVNARLSFANVTYAGLESWMGASGPRPFDAAVDGQITVSGPAQRIDALNASLQLTRVEAHSTNAVTTASQPRVQFELHNDGPVSAQLSRSVVTIQRARIVGPYSTLNLSGSASLGAPQRMNLRADANIRLDLLEAFSSNIFSSGAVALNAAVTGTPAKPSVNGRLQLQDASFNMTGAPNGVSNANGTVLFNGSEAVIQNLSAESGGGKITLSGSVGYGGPEMQFRVQARADQIHVRYPESITTTASAQLSLTGVTSSSLLSGTVRISEVAMHSHTDMGAMLNSAAAPPSAPSVSSGLMAGMKFDVRIMTTSGVQFRTELTENLQAEANLALRGNPDHPGMLGRVDVTQGKVVFLGNKYSVDQGTITFFDPNQIQPVLDIALSTTVQGVSVTLNVSGPADKMKLSYHSDPPLQFTEIVSLLASGKPPTSDPVLAARQAPPPQQNVGQAGASMLLGQAVASPVSGRLQRLFGVSKLQINPQVTGASNTPQATLTLQQQINSSMTFTYIQDVTQSNPQIIRIEWAMNPRWSAILARDINGEVNVDLFYKKRFH